MTSDIPGPATTRSYEYPIFDEGTARPHGLAYVEGVRDGREPGPPIMYTVGWDVTACEVGMAVLTLEPQPFQLSRFRRMHGGALAALIDSTAANAAVSTLGDGESTTTLELKTMFLRPVDLESGPITSTGTVVHRGSRVIVVEVIVTDGRDRVVTRGSATLLVLATDAPA